MYKNRDVVFEKKRKKEKKKERKTENDLIYKNVMGDYFWKKTC